jgi:hypothetical protein
MELLAKCLLLRLQLRSMRILLLLRRFCPLCLFCPFDFESRLLLGCSKPVWRSVIFLDRLAQPAARIGNGGRALFPQKCQIGQFLFNPFPAVVAGQSFSNFLGNALIGQSNNNSS